MSDTRVPAPHQCCCVIVYRIMGTEDSCFRMVDNPDNPFCNDCERNCAVAGFQPGENREWAPRIKDVTT